MAIGNLVVRGRVGFNAGDVKYIFTRGLSIGEEVEEEPTTAESLEWTLPANRLHYTLPDNRPHYTLPANRLHYTIPQ